jgi:DNA-directed RNA polymerase specialized sigma subunit
MERALNTGVTLKEIKVLSSPAEHDPMARDICNAVDACEVLYIEKSKAREALREILNAIDSVTDERQKEILIRRYVTGEGFQEICEGMNYERTQVFVIHGRALIEVNKWLEKQGGKRTA